MSLIIETLDALTAQGWFAEWTNPNIKAFLLTGDKKLLGKISKFQRYAWMPDLLLKALPLSRDFDDTGRRFLRLCLAVGKPEGIGLWVRKCCLQENPAGEAFAAACRIALECGCPKPVLNRQVADHAQPLLTDAGSPTPSGAFLLGLEDTELSELLREMAAANCEPLARLFLARAPHRWRRCLDSLPDEVVATFQTVSPWLVPLESATNEFLEPGAKAFQLQRDWNLRFKLGARLSELDPKRFMPAMEAIARTQLLTRPNDPSVRTCGESFTAACWLAENRGKAALPILGAYFTLALETQGSGRNTESEYKQNALELAFKKLGREALPLVESCFATKQPEVQLKALQLWAGLKQESDREELAVRTRQLLASAEPSVVARAVRLTLSLFPEAVEEDLWQLLSHKSKPVRDAAAAVLGTFGDSRLSRAPELWAARRADTRLAAVAWLKNLGTSEAAKTLKARLQMEEQEDLRDAILLALEKLAGSIDRPSSAELEERIQWTLKKLDGVPAPWISLDTLPAARLKDGSVLSRDWLRYLLYRQSRVKEMRPDIEARPLFEQLERRSSGDLALALMQAWLGSSMNSNDRWVLAFAAVVGDDRLVPVFTRQIKEWADSSRGKLAEYAVQALALLGTEAALLAVDALAIRYRSKYKNIGKAATEAFADAASRRRLTVEELGDLVVPWLGFEPGQPRIVDTPKGKLQTLIGNDFKLSFGMSRRTRKSPNCPTALGPR